MCGYSIDPTLAASPAAGGPGSVAVTASAPDCGWTAVSNDAWITVDPGTASGTGAGTVNYTVAANPLSVSRDGTVTIGGQTFTVTQAAPLTVTSVTANRTSPFVADGVTSVTWTAVATGGVAPLQYQFWRYNYGTGTAVMVQPYSGTSTFSWTPTGADAGTYGIGVWVKSSGSAAAFDVASWTPPFTISAAAPPVITSLMPDHSSPFVADGVTAVTWTTGATGGVAPLQYQFWRYNYGTGTAVMVQPYSSTSTFAWTPTGGDAGSYGIGVWVKSNGSAAAYDVAQWTAPYVISAATPPTITSLMADHASPFPADGVTSVTWTAVATGGVAPLQYQFWRYNYATGTAGIVQPYSSTNTFAWTPTGGDAGNYGIGVWVKSNGSAAAYEVARWTAPFAITAAAPPTITSMTVDRTSPFTADGVTTVTWTTTATGGVAPLQYQVLAVQLRNRDGGCDPAVRGFAHVQLDSKPGECRHVRHRGVGEEQWLRRGLRGRPVDAAVHHSVTGVS